ncbi:MAG: hypothetical protein WBQ73_01170, partial [Candidatus Babeliales bacterium]
MRNKLSKMSAFLLIALLFNVSLLSGAVNWNGGNTISADVIDNDLNINGGTITIDEGVHITALLTDVLVTVTAASVLQGTASGPSRIYFEAAQGRTITLCLNEDLTFTGSSGGTDLL